MLNLDKLLNKLVRSIGSEPILPYSGIPSASASAGGRVAVGMSSDMNTCWTVTALYPWTSQYYLVELYSQFNVDYTNSAAYAGTSGGFYYSALTQSATSATHPAFYAMATAKLSDLITVGGTETLVCRTAFGSYTTNTNTTTSSNMHSDLCVANDLNTLRFQAHKIGSNPGGLNTFSYVVSLWRVDNPGIYV